MTTGMSFHLFSLIHFFNYSTIAMNSIYQFSKSALNSCKDIAFLEIFTWIFSPGEFFIQFLIFFSTIAMN
jgi:hypothetical protein